MGSKPRRPWLAAVLTILKTGLGHIYSGNPKRGLILFFIAQLLILIFVVSLIVVPPTAVSMISATLIGVAFTAFCVVDAVLIARKKRKTTNRQTTTDGLCL